MAGIVQAKLVGGFGNQLHQYAAARWYAESVGARLEVPPGRRWGAIFGLDEPEWSRDLPEVNDGSAGHGPTLEPDQGRGDVRLGGYFQTQEWVGRLSRRVLRRWLAVVPDLERTYGRRGVYAAAHLRRGDYVGHPLYCTVSERSYARAADEHGISIDAWASEEHRRPGPPGLEFLGDWLLLLRARTLLRANSTFSWWAAALGDSDAYAPVVEDRVGEHDVAFVRGNWPRCADASRVGVRVDDLHLPE